MKSVQEKRVRWRSRRGMRELDVLLNRFIESRYVELDADGRELFDTLLDAPDTELYDWLIGRATPQNTDLAELVLQIRQSGC